MGEAVAVLEHRLPGRMRLRLRDRRGDEGFFAEVRQGLAGVGQVRTSAVTGSILITYAGEEAGVLEALRGRGLDVREAAPAAVAVRRAEPRELPTALDMTAIGLAAAGLVQVARGQVVGSASENLWNAFGIYAVTRQRLVPLVLTGLGLRQVLRGEALGSAVSLFLYALSAKRMARHRRVEDTI